MESVDIIMLMILLSLCIIGIIVFFPSYLRIQDNEIIKNMCGYIFNPATTLSNYTSYKHCLEYPETYGVNK